MINCEIDPISTLSSVCVIINSTDTRTFAITDRKVYVPVGNLSTKENENLSIVIFGWCLFQLVFLLRPDFNK